MRDIKFRAWDDETNEMKVMGDKYYSLSAGQILDRFTIVMQYTGLKDKNGVEIYEDDIIEFRIYPNERYRIASIKWYKYGYTIKNQNCHFVETTINTHVLFLNSETNIKVIGNVHVNPELLESQT